jgi:hypothetical protein
MHGKWEKCALFPYRRTVRCTNLFMEGPILQRDNHWTQDSVLISAVVSICGLVLGTLHRKLTQQPKKHSHWIYFLYFLRFSDCVPSKPWTGFDLNLAVKFLSFSQIIFLWCWRSMCPLQTALKVRENTLFYGKCGIPSSNVEINCVLCGWHWGQDYFHRFDENEHIYLPILCAIYGEHRRSAYFHTPGSTSGNSLIYCWERTLPSAWLFRRRFIFRLAPCCLWLFPNFGAQLYSTKPPICPIWEISVNVGGLNLSQSSVFWTS